jgi:hypothetical protein
LSAARGRPRRLTRWRAIGSVLSPRRGSQFSATLFARSVAASCRKRLKIVAAAWIAGDKMKSRFVPFCPPRRTSGPPRRDAIHSRAAARPAMIGRRLAAISSCQRAARFATTGPHVPRRHGPRVSVQVCIPDAEPWRKGQLLATAAPRAACGTGIDGCRQRPRLQSTPRLSPALEWGLHIWRMRSWALHMGLHTLVAWILTRPGFYLIAIMRAVGPKNRFQFSIRSALVGIALVSLVLTGAVNFPRVAVGTLPIVVFCALMFVTLYSVDRKVTRDSAPPRNAIGSWILISVSTWTTAFIWLLSILRLPGGAGPVQYTAGSPWAEFVFCLRGGTMIIFFVCPIISVLVGGFRLAAETRIRPGWLVAGICAYLIACLMVLNNSWFFPTV